jgi:thiamine kinase-like enzyme
MEESTKSSEALHRALRALVPDWNLEGVGPADYLSGGYSNRNYRIEYQDQAYVLRLPERQRPFVDRTREEAFYRQPNQVRIPELVAFDATTGAMLTRFEAGKLLSDSVQTPEALIAYLSDLHASLPPSGRDYDPLALTREFLAVGRVPDWVRKLADALVWRPATLVPCHNDLNPWNVIRPPTGAWVTLDWEWFGDNDPLFDLVTLHQGLELADDVLHEMALLWTAAGGSNKAAAETVADELGDSRIHHCLIVFWLREYAWAHAEAYHGNPREEVAEQIETGAKKLRQLMS